MDFCFSFGWRKRPIREGRLFVRAILPLGSDLLQRLMIRHSEHMIQEQIFSNSLFEGTKIPIHAEPVE
jgi:hypothetical protein